MSDSADESRDEVGSLAEETAKLLDALQGWATASGDAHVTEGQECTWCPMCRVLHRLHEVSPEVRTHLAVAASSLLQAASGLLATKVPAADPPQPRVHKIDLDDVSPPGE